MQSFLSRIWTRVAVSISYADNHYTTERESSLFFKSQPVSDKKKKNTIQIQSSCILHKKIDFVFHPAYGGGTG